MSRVKLMLNIIDDVCNVAEGLQNLSDSLRTMVKAIDSDEQPKLPDAEPKAKEEADSQPATPSAEKQITLAEVRAVLAGKSRSGKTAQVKELLIKHGADKLSDIEPSEYKSLLADAEVL